MEIKLPNGDTVTVRYVPNGTYTTNPENSNRGKPRGDAAIRSSMRDVGFHRGITVSADDTAIAGNHASSIAQEEEVIDGWIEVTTNGRVGVATKRIDWKTARTPKALLAAILDNRTNELNYDLDPVQFALDVQLLSEQGEVFEPEAFTLDEINELLGKAGSELLENDDDSDSDDPDPDEPRLNCCPNCGHQW